MQLVGQGLAFVLLLSSASFATSTRKEELAAARGLLQDSNPATRVQAIIQQERRRSEASRQHGHRHSPSTQLLQLPVPADILAAASSGSVTGASADSATESINAMIRDERGALDEKVLECRVQTGRVRDAASTVTEETRELSADINFHRAFLGEAMSGQAEQEEEAFKELQSSSKFGKRKCSETKVQLHSKKLLLTQDARDVARIQQLVSAQCGTAMLVQTPVQKCKMPRRARAVQLSKVSRGLSKKLRHRVQGVLLQLSETTTEDSPRRHRRGRGHKRHHRVPRLRAHSVQPATSLTAAGSEHRVHRQDPGRPLCQLEHGTCGKMEAVLVEVAGEIEDNTARLTFQQADLEKDCKQDREYENSEMLHASRARGDLGSKLADSASKLSILMERQKEKDAERNKLEVELSEIDNECTTGIHAILFDKICGLQRIRDSLQLAAGRTELPEDCEVTDWTDGDCSVSCGSGGSETLTREVVLPANGGVECPPLEMMQPCESVPCPVDCVISEWSPWSSCSAECDGGMKERTRNVVTQDRNDGDACPELIDTVVCNTAACSKDCELTDWVPWSGCSQACGGGVKERRKHVEAPPVGDGRCPGNDAQERLERAQCNIHVCPQTEATVTCAGQDVDIVLLVDSSSTLDDAGFTNLKNLASAMVDMYSPRADGPAHVAIAGFAGTTHVGTYLTQDGGAASSAAGALAHVGGPSKLAAGLLWAGKALMIGGRKGAASTVMVISDGRLADPWKAGWGAWTLHQAGVRLMFVTVTDAADRRDGEESENVPQEKFLKAMASEPANENLIWIPGMTHLADNTNLVAKQLVEGTCSETQ